MNRNQLLARALVGMSLFASVGTVVLPSYWPVNAAAQSPLPDLREAAMIALGTGIEAKMAIAQLRAAGPSGLAALLDVHRSAIARNRISSHNENPEEWKKLCERIDAVAAQKDAYASELYWYTDFEAAKAAAHKSGKQILSLRLLGTLDTEFSCANSRFFRTVLYANEKVSKVLTDRYILHWKSVRPVPKLTIDMGDGRVVERTVTGNSIHYVLNADGQVLDAIPGLYGPEAFLAALDTSYSASNSKQWHAEQAVLLTQKWREDMSVAGWNPTSQAMGTLSTSAIVASPFRSNPTPPSISSPTHAFVFPSAVDAAPQAIGKLAIESPMVLAFNSDKLSGFATGGNTIRASMLTPTSGLVMVNNPIVNNPTSLSSIFFPQAANSGTISIATNFPSAAMSGTTTASKGITESRLLKEVSATGPFPLGTFVLRPNGSGSMAGSIAVTSPLISLRIDQSNPKQLGIQTTNPVSFSPLTFVTDSASNPKTLEVACTDLIWKKIAQSHLGKSKLDRRSIAVMSAKSSRLLAAADGATRFNEMVKAFETSVSEDTVRNEYLFHRQIHDWLAAGKLSDGKSATDVDALNERIYADLFLTPSADPWLGLLPANTYSAIDNDGICPTK